MIIRLVFLAFPLAALSRHRRSGGKIPRPFRRINTLILPRPIAAGPSSAHALGPGLQRTSLPSIWPRRLDGHPALLGLGSLPPLTGKSVGCFSPTTQLSPLFCKTPLHSSRSPCEAHLRRDCTAHCFGCTSRMSLQVNPTALAPHGMHSGPPFIGSQYPNCKPLSSCWPAYGEVECDPVLESDTESANLAGGWGSSAPFLRQHFTDNLHLSVHLVLGAWDRRVTERPRERRRVSDAMLHGNGPNNFDQGSMAAGDTHQLTDCSGLQRGGSKTSGHPLPFASRTPLGMQRSQSVGHVASLE